MFLYLKTTTDEYELPLAVAESVRELAELTGIPERSMASLISRVRKGTADTKCYHIVEVEDDD